MASEDLDRACRNCGCVALIIILFLSFHLWYIALYFYFDKGDMIQYEYTTISPFGGIEKVQTANMLVLDKKFGILHDTNANWSEGQWGYWLKLKNYPNPIWVETKDVCLFGR